jgi:hypothetical protein
VGSFSRAPKPPFPVTHATELVGSGFGDVGSAYLRVRLRVAFCWLMVSLLGLFAGLLEC